MKFEYMKLLNCDLSKLNEAGMDGWELCGVVNTQKNDRIFYFKRLITVPATDTGTG